MKKKQSKIEKNKVKNKPKNVLGSACHNNVKSTFERIIKNLNKS